MSGSPPALNSTNQQLELPHIRLTEREGVELEIERPQGVRTDRAHRPDMGSDTGETLLALLGRDAEAFVAPQPPDTLVVHLPGAVAVRGC